MLNPTSDNVLAVYDRATSGQIERGMAWYEVARGIARGIANGDVRMGAGVLAALSPNESWPRNIVLARQAFENGVASGTLGNSCLKANAIMAGAVPLDVMGKGLKTRNFFANIFDPECAESITIDRHAYDVALDMRNVENKRLCLTPKRYAAFGAAYLDAASKVGILPNQLQAITWETWRDKWAWKK